MAHKEIDHATGVETTGHVWDGDLKELNKPLPRWWLLTFYASIVWAIGYFIVYPAWPIPGGYTKGIWNYSQRQTVMDEVKAGKTAQAAFLTDLDKTPIKDVAGKPDLYKFARASGAASFANNCAPCHGRGAQGATGYPNLNDDDWIWGGKIEDIVATIQHGIRDTGDKATRDSAMPKFGADKLLTEAQVNDTAEYVLSLSGKAGDKTSAERGSKIFAEQCVACHGADAKGNRDLGAPNLTDAIWLYGGTKKDVFDSIWTGRGGMMPSWASRLDNPTIKSLAVYVHSLGGGTK
jgi:cytochrome c oxidase cbb3-type subunit 3